MLSKKRGSVTGLNFDGGPGRPVLPRVTMNDGANRLAQLSVEMFKSTLLANSMHDQDTDARRRWFVASWHGGYGFPQAANGVFALSSPHGALTEAGILIN